MKRWRWILLMVVAFAFLCIAIVVSTSGPTKTQRRAELHMLGMIAGGVEFHLHAGGQLPTNWPSLSNSVNWSRVSGICSYNHLPQPEESYTVLARPVTNTATQAGGFCFLVSSKPAKWPRRNGRWALVVWPKPLPADVPGVRSTNRVLRVWLREESLSPEIRSQLTN
jgi:hypothetical protein